MTIAAQTISISLDGTGIELVDALATFAASRSSKALVRRSQERDVRYDMRVPVFLDCRVNSRSIANGLRRLIRETMDEAEPGDRAVIDFALTPDDHLTLTVRPWEPPQVLEAARR